MKNLKLVVALVVFAMVATSVGFAGPSKGGKLAQPSTPQGRTMRFLSPVKDSDVPAGRALKSSRINFRSLVAKNPTLSKPVPLAKAPSGVNAKLTGVYHIPGDIASLGLAVQIANLLGVSGNTTFELDDTSYSEGPITFGSWPGNDTYTLTISPGPGVPVVFTFESDSLHGKGFSFVGAKNVTIDGLNTGGASLSLVWDQAAPFPLGDPFGSTVYITGASDHIAVKNASVQGNVNTPAWVDQSEGRSAIFVYAADADPNYNTNLTFDGLTITRATYGIKCLPESPAVTVDGLDIENCKIGGAYGDPVAIGGFYEYVSDVTFANNVIDGSQFLDWYWNNAYTEYDVDVAFGVGPIFYNLGQSTGSHFISVDAGVFHDNIIRNVSVNGVAGEGLLSYGTRISQGNNGLGVTALVYNNRVYGITNPGGSTAQITGIRGTAGHVYHNSIRLSGTLVGSGMVSRCLNGTTDAYNNALSNESTGPTLANITAIVSGGTIDYNAAYSTGRVVSGFATAAAAAAGGVNPHGVSGPVNFTADLHLNAAGPSSAENMGKPHVLAKADIDGDPRDTTIAGTRDAGADEVSAALTNSQGPSVGVGSITSPNAGGVPAGLVQTPVVVVKNNSRSAAGPFNLELKVNDGYDHVISVSLNPQETKSITFPTWTPAPSLVNYTDTITATTSLGGDVDPSDDILTRTQLVQAPVSITADTTFTWNAGAQGWTGSVDFVRDNAFTKLGGPVNSYAWVTESPYNHNTYTEGAYASTQGYASTYPGANFLTSPWFNLSSLATDVYVSFQQSINTEPGWDGGWMEYTTDGTTWHQLGKLNDTHGINWYSQAVYQNAQSYNAPNDVNLPPDTATMRLYGLLYPQGSINYPTDAGFPFWTSNGNPGVVGSETAPTGPNGWVFVQLHITAATYPAIVGAPLVKFRYVAFSDAATAYQGWAIDNFHIGPNGASFTGGVIQGTAYTDVNGNGVNDAEPAVTGKKVYLSYFGVVKDSVVTNGSGFYSFNLALSNSGLPGAYGVTLSGVGNVAFDVPFNTNTATLNHDGLGDTLTQDFGIYDGSVTGHVISDLNDNGATDGGEPGLFHWVVEAHKDSLNGPIVDTILTDAAGAYSMELPSANYVLKVLSPLQIVGNLTTTYRPTSPLSGNEPISITGSSGSGTAVLTGVDFEEFLFNQIRVVCAVDLNGDGVKNASDFAALTTGAVQAFKFYHNGVFVNFDTVGNTASYAQHYVDTGSYSVMRVSPLPPPLWLKTTAQDSFSFTATTGAVIDSAIYLYYKLGVASGRYFSDLNANAVEDSAEPGLAGWPVNISGAGGGTVLTDSLGNWVINTLAQGPHTVTEGAPLPGFTPTLTPLPATLTWANQLSGSSNANNHVALDFGKFKNVTVSGTVYRDRNHNGVRDAGEEAVAGVTVNLTGQTGVVSDANGTFTFTNVPPSPDTVSLSATAPAGYSVTSGPFSIILLSGDTTQQARTLGVFFNADTMKYRTFTAEELRKGAATKIQKAWTAKKPSVPTLANALNAIFLVNSAIVKAGVAGLLNPSSKEYASIYPAKYSDAFATFSAKGVGHSGPPRGLDVDNKGALLLKKSKSMPETKKNDILIADLLALKVNIASTPIQGTGAAGIGNYIYHEAGNPLSGKTVSQIGLSCDTVMTLWQGVPYTTYVMYDSVIAKINAAFSDTLHAALDTNIWKLGTGVVKVAGVKSVYQVPFLSANPGMAPTQAVGTGKIAPIPVSYKLEQNYPNPFNPTTSITFEVPGPAVVTIKVYNMLGQEVVTLLNNQVYDVATRDNVDFNGANVASGVYFYRIVAQSLDDNGVATSKTFTEVKKMLLVK